MVDESTIATVATRFSIPFSSIPGSFSRAVSASLVCDNGVDSSLHPIRPFLRIVVLFYPEDNRGYRRTLQSRLSAAH